ncbi:hypothetical protein CBR_g52355 [Chara braunii]|uniref:Uncharacterized protein n=1 Tax=Chara braunii TaxID=69332 RepID=A0A388K6T0_CHABU|nr:hypothetical protein CBR_g52355 [Chara braunii]|eukprot:GBG65764.1 hypothetical protein CBR_g52355 [Chara braunii]
MFSAKRRTPSGGLTERGKDKISKDDDYSVYEHTLRRLISGARISAAPPADVPGGGWFGATSCGGVGRCGSSVSTRTAGSSSKIVFRHVEEPPPSLGKSAEVAASRQGKEVDRQDDAEESSPCAICSSFSLGTSCAHCERKICEFCCRTCDGCQHVYCTSCSTPNYEERYDRTFCLDCNVEELRGGGKTHAVSFPPPFAPVERKTKMDYVPLSVAFMLCPRASSSGSNSSSSSSCSRSRGIGTASSSSSLSMFASAGAIGDAMEMEA